MAMPDFLDNEPPEVTQAKELAKRYRLPYIDLLPPDKDSPISYEELAGIPVELMLRNQFVPLRREGRNLHVGMADPSNLEVLGRTRKCSQCQNRAVCGDCRRD